ncbi:MAG: SHOCT domain-containing protein [Nitrospirota bacterium]
MDRGIMGWDMGIGMVFYLAFWILVIAGIVLLVVWVGQKALGTGSRPEESAIEILKKRYVRGEISKAEYEEKKRDLG